MTQRPYRKSSECDCDCHRPAAQRALASYPATWIVPAISLVLLCLELCALAASAAAHSIFYAINAVAFGILTVVGGIGSALWFFDSKPPWDR